jgi:hypothetical protein
VEFIQKEAVHAFIDGVRDREIQHDTLMGGDRSLNEDLNQAVTLEAAKAENGPPARLRDVIRAPRGKRPPTAERQCAGTLGTPVTLAETVCAELMRKPTRTREMSKGQREEWNAGVITLNPSFYTERAVQGER